MRTALCLTAFLLSLAISLEAQDIDSSPLIQRRSVTTIADQISDPSERSAFLALFHQASPSEMLARADQALYTNKRASKKPMPGPKPNTSVKA